MNKKEEEKLTMYHTVVNFYDLNSDVAGNMDAFVKTMDDFKQLVGEIDYCVELQLKIITGYSTNKLMLRTALIEEAASIAARVFSYGKASGNVNLQESVSYTASYLERLKDNELAPVCRLIHRAGLPLVSYLGPYNLKAVHFDDFNKHIALYAASLSMPRSAIVERRGHRTTLKALFKRGDDLLKGHLDKQAREFKSTDLEFYSNYKASREIVKTGSTPTQIKGVVVNKKTKAVIAGATITVLENDMAATSDENGNYVVKRIPSGTYTLKLTAEGFEPITLTGVKTKRGKIKRVTFSLTAKGS